MLESAILSLSNDIGETEVCWCGGISKSIEMIEVAG